MNTARQQQPEDGAMIFLGFLLECGSGKSMQFNARSILSLSDGGLGENHSWQHIDAFLTNHNDFEINPIAAPPACISARLVDFRGNMHQISDAYIEIEHLTSPSYVIFKTMKNSPYSMDLPAVNKKPVCHCVPYKAALVKRDFILLWLVKC